MERFEFRGNLGEGAYGTVWACMDVSTNKMVAMKRFKEAHTDEDVLYLAHREIHLLKASVHPNVVKLHEAFKSKSGRVYMVMEHVEGTLTQHLRKHPRGFSANTVKLITFQLLQATAFLHSSKVMHRDLKPANILMASDGTVKLCDFGFARSVTAAGPADYTPYVVTRWYRPPEILVGGSYGTAVDIWAIGCLLAEMATGEPLLPGKDTLDQLWLTMRTLGPLPDWQMDRLSADGHLAGVKFPTAAELRPLSKRYPELSPQVMEVLSACLHPDPARRLTAAEVLALPFFDDVYEYLEGTQLQEAYDDAYAAALNNGTPSAACLRAASSACLKERAASTHRHTAAGLASPPPQPRGAHSVHFSCAAEALQDGRPQPEQRRRPTASRSFGKTACAELPQGRRATTDSWEAPQPDSDAGVPRIKALRSGSGGGGGHVEDVRQAAPEAHVHAHLRQSQPSLPKATRHRESESMSGAMPHLPDAARLSLRHSLTIQEHSRSGLAEPQQHSKLSPAVHDKACVGLPARQLGSRIDSLTGRRRSLVSTSEGEGEHGAPSRCTEQLAAGAPSRCCEHLAAPEPSAQALEAMNHRASTGMLTSHPGGHCGVPHLIDSSSSTAGAAANGLAPRLSVPHAKPSTLATLPVIGRVSSMTGYPRPAKSSLLSDVAGTGLVAHALHGQGRPPLPRSISSSMQDPHSGDRIGAPSLVPVCGQGYSLHAY